MLHRFRLRPIPLLVSIPSINHLVANGRIRILTGHDQLVVVHGDIRPFCWQVLRRRTPIIVPNGTGRRFRNSRVPIRKAGHGTHNGAVRIRSFPHDHIGFRVTNIEIRLALVHPNRIALFKSKNINSTGNTITNKAVQVQPPPPRRSDPLMATFPLPDHSSGNRSRPHAA